jgi:CRISPR-associated endonuclease Csn1
MPVEKLGLETLRIDRVEEASRSAKFVVRDGAVRRALLAHLEATNKPPAKAYPPYPCVSSGGPEIRKARVLMLRQKSLMVPVAKSMVADSQERQPNGFADPSTNHHIAIYRLAEGTADFEVVSLYEASRRLAKREPVVRRAGAAGAVFVMSLSPGDALQFPSGERQGVWIVRGAWANGQVVIERANDAVKATTTQPTASALLRDGARKIAIDPIGRVRPAND